MIAYLELNSMECRPPRKLVKFVETEGKLQPTVVTVPDLADHTLGKTFPEKFTFWWESFCLYFLILKIFNINILNIISIFNTKYLTKIHIYTCQYYLKHVSKWILWCFLISGGSTISREGFSPHCCRCSYSTSLGCTTWVQSRYNKIYHLWPLKNR